MINDILFNRRSVILKLMKLPKSPAKNRLISILKASNDEIIIAAFNAWGKEKYGIKLMPCNISLPASTLPDIGDPDEFFQWVTDSLKKSI